MRVTWTFIEVIAIGIIVGLLVFLLAGRIKSSGRRKIILIVFGSVAGVIAFVISGIFFFFLGLTPASDDVISSRDEVRLDIVPESPFLTRPQAGWGFDRSPGAL